MKEEEVVQYLIKHLEKKGWIIDCKGKKLQDKGCDIEARHPRWRKYFYIEAKGDTKNKYISFNTCIGQILSRMDIEGNHNNRGRYYSIAIPSEWEDFIRRRAKKMAYGWRLLKLKVFLVNEKQVEQKGFSHFLK